MVSPILKLSRCVWEYSHITVPLSVPKGYTEVIELMVSRGASPCVPSSSGHLVSSQVEHAHVQRTLDVMMKRHADKYVQLQHFILLRASYILVKYVLHGP